jgi:hypothetical protein
LESFFKIKCFLFFFKKIQPIPITNEFTGQLPSEITPEMLSHIVTMSQALQQTQIQNQNQPPRPPYTG